jgi:hypothetical protein
MMIDDDCMEMRRKYPEVWIAAYAASFVRNVDDAKLTAYELTQLAASHAMLACAQLDAAFDERWTRIDNIGKTSEPTSLPFPLR